MAKSTKSVPQQVVAMRDKDQLSWAAIGESFGFAPRTARAHYQSIKGEHSHHGLLPGKGGRLPTSTHNEVNHGGAANLRKPAEKATKVAKAKPAAKKASKATAKKAA